MDYQALPPVDLLLAADPDAVVPRSARARSPRDRGQAARGAAPAPPRTAPRARGALSPTRISRRALRDVVGERRDVSLTHLPLVLGRQLVDFRHPLDYLGSDGGGGVGGGPGISVGAALALKGSGRLPSPSAATAIS